MNKSHKLSSLEGLRGIAAFVVVIYHLRSAFYAVSAHHEARSYLTMFLQHPSAFLLKASINGLCNGTFAVWLFWIMSGFVLSFQFFVRVHQATVSAAHDYLEDASLRRYPRLLIPVLASVVFAYLLCYFQLMHNVVLAHTLGEPYVSGWLARWYTFSAGIFGAIKSAVWNCFFAYDESSTYNNVLWTMEEEFYGSLFIFAFLSLLGHRRSRFSAYLLVASFNLLLPLNWLNAFVGGIFICDLFINRNNLSRIQPILRWPALNFIRNNAFLAAILWVCIIISAGAPNYQGVLYLIIGMGAVILALISKPTQFVLSSVVPMYLGRISFGLYLIHVPIICSFSCWAYLAISDYFGSGMTAFLVSIMTCVLSIALGHLLYIIADQPGIRISRLLSSLIMNRAVKKHVEEK